jgi:GT2 family glycosyltransferase
MLMMREKVCIVIVNWNGWVDTIECLESIFRCTYLDYTVVVCDNNSQDNSLEYIKAWARGELDILIPKSSPLHYLSFPSVRKPIVYEELKKSEIEHLESGESKAQIALIDIGKNLGFGTANNIGIEYAFLKNADFVWLLNNDTVIQADAITKMVKTARIQGGIIGGTLRYYTDPSKIQAFGGGYFSSWTGLVRHHDTHKKSLNFITGASLMIDKFTFDILGGFDENIFMYCEDFEYCIRASKNHIPTSCSDAIIYHKIGSSSGGDMSYFSCLSVYKNKFYSLKKNYGIGLWVVIYFFSILFHSINPSTNNNKRKAAKTILTGKA